MIGELSRLPPGSLLVLGALAVPLLRGRALRLALLALPLVSFAHLLLTQPAGTLVELRFFDYVLTPVRVDRLSLVWGYVFHLAALLGAIYAIHVKDRLQHAAGLIYIGAALGAVFAGDLLTLFVYWELTAISSVFLIWASRSERAYRAGMRYLQVQVGSGVLLLAGAVLQQAATGSLAFGRMQLSGAGPTLIFLAFGIKCAFPLLHNWLQDAYPESTASGTVILSVYTTKLAVYALARGFPGTEILVPIGAAMTAFPIFFAVIENDLRRVLCYSLNNQLGFMVVGIGIGTELAINGAAAHAFANILFEALLLMAMGAVLYRVGTVKGSELGGLHRSMPLTTGLCCIGAASISAFPLFSGFVSKSPILAAAAEGHYTWTFVALLFASAGVFHHSGIKIPYFAFFAHDSGKRCREAPWNMLVAMGLTALLCVALGCVPGLLYSIVPYPMDYQPYTTTHVLTQLQLLLFSALAFGFLQLTGLYPPELRSVNLDSDWVYRRLAPATLGPLLRAGAALRRAGLAATLRALGAGAGLLAPFRADGVLARSWTIGSTVLWIAALLGISLLLYLR